MKLVKKGQDTVESGLGSLVERGGSSKIGRLLNLARMLSSWRGRIWSLLLVVLLMIFLVPYLRATAATLRHGLSPSTDVPLPLFLIAGTSAIAFFSLTRPVWALAVFFAVVPVTSGLVTWVGIGDPALQRKAGLLGVELLFLSLALGLLLRRVIWPDPGGARRVENGVTFYALAVLSSMILFYLSDPWWWDRLILAWRHIPSGRQLSPNHPFRAGLLILASLLCYRLTVDRLKTSEEIRLVCRGWLVGAGLTGFYGLSVWATWQWGQYAQIGSLLEDVNAYGSYLVLILFIAWGEWLSEKKWWARAMAGLVVLLTVLMIPLAGSRIAMIAATVGAGIAWTTLARSVKGRWVRRGVLATLGGGILLFSIAGGHGLIDRVIQAHPKLASLGLAHVAQAVDAQFTLDRWWGSRRGLVAAGTRMIEENPVFGLGPGTAYRELGRGDYYEPDGRYVIDRHENLHNYFVQVAAETGLLGLAGFLWAVLAIVVQGFLRNSGNDRLLARFFSIGVGAYLITAFTSHPLILSRQALLFWGSLGILRACSQLGHASSSGRQCSSQE